MARSPEPGDVGCRTGYAIARLPAPGAADLAGVHPAPAMIDVAGRGH